MPCQQRIGVQPHIQIVGDQIFETEWALGYAEQNQPYYFITTKPTKESDYGKLNLANLTKIILDYLNHAPPASQLIGIELNPGPTRRNAQLIFSDGLHSIFGYLDSRSWLASSRTCSSWYRIAGRGGVISSLNRKLTLTRATLSELVTMLRAGQHSALRHHLTSINHTYSSNWGGTLSEWQSLMALLPLYSSLATITLWLAPLSVDFAPLTQCPNLSSLTFLDHCGFMINLIHDPNMCKDRNSPSIRQLKQQMRVLASISTLAHLSLTSSKSVATHLIDFFLDRGSETQPEYLLCFPHLQSFDLSHWVDLRTLTPSKLHAVAPNLTRLAPSDLDENPFRADDKFANLREFKIPMSTWDKRSLDIERNSLVNFLSTCSSLSTLQLIYDIGNWHPSSEQWNRLFTSLPNLIAVDFDFATAFRLGSTPALISLSGSPSACRQLKSLMLHGSLDSFHPFALLTSIESLSIVSEMECHKWIERFDDATLLPMLTRFEVRQVTIGLVVGAWAHDEEVKSIDTCFLFDQANKKNTQNYRKMSSSATIV